MKLSSHRLSQLQEHYFAGLEGRIQQLHLNGRKVYHLDVGSPDLPPAEHIVDALRVSAAYPDHHKYQPLYGSEAIRSAWAGHYQHHYGVTVDPSTQILPLMGSKEGIFMIMQAILDLGDLVLLPDPAYMVYQQAARFALADAYFMPLLSENGWLPDLEAIPNEVLKRARLLWLNYPNNPTSATATMEFFEAAIAFARKNDLLLCHDAAYSLVTFGDTHPLSLLEIPGATDVALEFNTLSKAYNMAGWRIGAAVGNPQAIHSLYRLLATVTSGSFRPSTDAAITALTGEQSWILNRNKVYQDRRDMVIKTLNSLNFDALVPHAGLYVWFCIPDTAGSSIDFCGMLLDQTGVSLTPGSVFGAHGEGYVRLSITLPNDELKAALQLMAEFIINYSPPVKK